MERPEPNETRIGESVGEICRVPCPTCQVRTAHKVVASADYHWTADDAWDIRGITRYQVVECQGCQTLSFRLEDGNSEMQDPETGEYYTTSQLYPPRIPGRQTIRDRMGLPGAVGELYDQVIGALGAGHWALAAIGMRALVERVCVEEGAKGWGLEEKINALVSLKKVTTEQAALLEPIRHAGNAAAHEAEAPSLPEIHAALDVVEHLLAGVYLLKFRIARLTARYRRDKS